VTQQLRQEELVSKDALKLCEAKDFKEMGLPIGCVKLIMNDITQWNNSAQINEDHVDSGHHGVTGDNEDILTGAGKILDALLSNKPAPSTEVSAFVSHFMDPRTILTMRSKNQKAVHITTFLTEKSKRRRQNKRKEFILRTGTGDPETLVLKTEEEHPYLGIYIEEWSAANMRLLNHLLQSGALRRDEIEFYLAYTTKIYEFAEIYEWNSVLHFDFTYRELQAEHTFKWGTFSPHMEMQILVPKRARHQPSTHAQPGSQPNTHAREDCRIFKAKGSCPFGTNCRYRHPNPLNNKASSHDNAGKNTSA
jgi:hypothetical protein